MWRGRASALSCPPNFVLGPGSGRDVHFSSSRNVETACLLHASTPRIYGCMILNRPATVPPAGHVANPSLPPLSPTLASSATAAPLPIRGSRLEAEGPWCRCRKACGSTCRQIPQLRKIASCSLDHIVNLYLFYVVRCYQFAFY